MSESEGGSPRNLRDRFSKSLAFFLSLLPSPFFSIQCPHLCLPNRILTCIDSEIKRLQLVECERLRQDTVLQDRVQTLLAQKHHAHTLLQHVTARLAEVLGDNNRLHEEVRALNRLQEHCTKMWNGAERELVALRKQTPPCRDPPLPTSPPAPVSPSSSGKKPLHLAVLLPGSACCPFPVPSVTSRPSSPSSSPYSSLTDAAATTETVLPTPPHKDKHRITKNGIETLGRIVEEEVSPLRRRWEGREEEGEEKMPDEEIPALMRVDKTAAKEEDVVRYLLERSMMAQKQAVVEQEDNRAGVWAFLSGKGGDRLGGEGREDEEGGKEGGTEEEGKAIVLSCAQIPAPVSTAGSVRTPPSSLPSHPLPNPLSPSLPRTRPKKERRAATRKIRELLARIHVLIQELQALVLHMNDGEEGERRKKETTKKSHQRGRTAIDQADNKGRINLADKGKIQADASEMLPPSPELAPVSKKHLHMPCFADPLSLYTPSTRLLRGIEWENSAVLPSSRLSRPHAREIRPQQYGHPPLLQAIPPGRLPLPSSRAQQRLEHLDRVPLPDIKPPSSLCRPRWPAPIPYGRFSKHDREVKEKRGPMYVV